MTREQMAAVVMEHWARVDPKTVAKWDPMALKAQAEAQASLIEGEMQDHLIWPGTTREAAFSMAAPKMLNNPPAPPRA